MDTSTFMDLFGTLDEAGAEPQSATGAVRLSLERGKPWCCETTGDGTQYRCSGARFGAGFSEAYLTLREDGLAVVSATSVPVPPECERQMTRLCRVWNKSFAVTRMYVREGVLVFESEPFDPVNPAGGVVDSETAIGLTLAMVHKYASVVIALEAGMDPLELMGAYDPRPDGGGCDDDDDGGEGMPSDEHLMELFARHRAIREGQPQAV